jgi:alkylhydroperoxidase/carboxymuconolactone decarboxylase family protein YurZ
MEPCDEILRRLTLGDAADVDTLVRTQASDGTLDARSIALLRLGALAADDGAGIVWHRVVGDAIAAGVTTDELAEALIVLTPTLGANRVVGVAPKLALAAGYDVEAALEAIG